MSGLDQRLMDVVGDAYGFADLDEFRSGILPLLRTAVPNDYAAYNEVDIDPERMWGISDPVLPPETPRRWARLPTSTRCCSTSRRTRDGRPRRISDFLDRAAFRRTRLYLDFYAPLGIESQVSFTLPSRPPVVVAIALSRGPDDFADEEVDAADARPPAPDPGLPHDRAVERPRGDAGGAGARPRRRREPRRGGRSARSHRLRDRRRPRAAGRPPRRRRAAERLPRALLDALARRRACARARPSRCCSAPATTC